MSSAIKLSILCLGTPSFYKEVVLGFTYTFVFLYMVGWVVFNRSAK